MPPLLETRSLTRIFRSGTLEVSALRGCDLELEAGEFLALFGPSGCGKSTLLNLLGGMDRPTQGEVFFRGEPLSPRSDLELTLYRRNHVGFIFQFYNLVPSLTALENLKLVAEIVPDSLDPAETLERVGLGDRGDHFPAQLSGGEQQRVAIARALLSQPDFLLCDEPTGALDLETSRRVLAVLNQVREERETAVVLVTHNQEITRLAHRVAWMRDGAIARIESQTPARIDEVSW